LKTVLIFFAALAAAAAVSETRIVSVGDFYFLDHVSQSAHTRINVGDSVRWQWVTGNHTTTEVNKLWNAPINSITTFYQRTFTEPGYYEYYCAMDPLVMRGTVRVDGVMTHVRPISFDVQPGRVVSGGLGELFDSDDNRLVMRPGVVLTSAAYPIVLRASGLVPPGTGEHLLSIRVESHATSGNVIQRVRLYDPFKDEWVEVHIGFVSTTDTVVEAIVTDPERFMTPATGTTVAEVSFKALGPVLFYPWQARVDQLEWVAQ
jgi:plastocyanin